MRTLAAGLSCLLVLQMGSTTLSAQTDSGKLNLVIVEGDGAINNIRQRTAREPIVQVEDENHKPVAGAAVVFLLPNQGASGVFANGVQGKLQMRVSPSYQGKTASTTISQTNSVAATAGAAAAAGISAKLIV